MIDDDYYEQEGALMCHSQEQDLLFGGVDCDQPEEIIDKVEPAIEQQKPQVQETFADFIKSRPRPDFPPILEG